MDNFLFKTNKRKKRLVLLGLIALVAVLLVALEIVVQSRANEQGAERTAQLLLNDLSGVLHQNEKEKSLLIDAQKEACISHAKAVAYMLDYDTEAVNSQLKLRQMMELTAIDEIHIFNAQGVIVAGTVPKYYGYSLQDGEQMNFFLPMLENKSLVLCQDLMPNTAEGKRMMYAAVWDRTGTRIIEIGVEPRRLMEALRQSELKYLLQMMPAAEGMNFFVASRSTGEVYGATQGNFVGKNLSEWGLAASDMGYDDVSHRNAVAEGTEYLCSMQLCGPYVIGVMQDMQQIQQSLYTNVTMVVAYLLLAALVLLFVVRKLRGRLQQETSARERQQDILVRMAEIYYSIHLLDLDKDRAEEYYAEPEVKNLMDYDKPLSQQMLTVMAQLITLEHLPRMLRFINFKTLPERLKDRKMISEDFLGIHCWVRATFIVIDRHEDGTPHRVVFRTLNIDEEKQKEIKLLLNSTTDGLTGCLNRHACDVELEKYRTEPLPGDFVVVVLDVNGLKEINDTLGHVAGDELICAAADTIRSSFSPYGNVYRVGGDEFVALLKADAEHLQAARDDFALLQSNWSGHYVKEMHISAGYAPCYELTGLSLRELAKEADKRMYRDKSAFYRNKGVDRRGQQASIKELSNIYTKILQVNLTEDSYQIVRMQEAEKTAAYGFAGKLSIWMHDFAMTGQVHAGDREEYLAKTTLAYLRDYFHQGKNRFVITYRRRDGDGYKRVMMEIIRGQDYKDDRQSVYLYVKNIE